MDQRDYGAYIAAWYVFYACYDAYIYKFILQIRFLHNISYGNFVNRFQLYLELQFMKISYNEHN